MAHRSASARKPINGTLAVSLAAAAREWGVKVSQAAEAGIADGLADRSGGHHAVRGAAGDGLHLPAHPPVERGVSGGAAGTNG